MKNLLFAFVLTLCLLPTLFAQTAIDMSGVWNGTWTSPSGYLYLGELHLTGTADGRVEGKIVWTLRKSPREEEQGKISLSGIEFVRGTFDSTARILEMSGYRKDDPDGVIGLDRYRLVLSETNKVVGGLTHNHGTWQGLAMFVRDEE